MTFTSALLTSPRKAIFVCLLAAAAAAFLLLETARAQEGTQPGYVDLVMLAEYGTASTDTRVRYRVKNNGTATATGVSVSFLLEDLQVGDFSGYAPTTTKTGTTQSFATEVGTLSPGETKTAHEFNTDIHSARIPDVFPGWGGLVGFIEATASSHEPELDILLANNVKKVYSFVSDSAGASWHMTDNKLALLLSVDDLRPAVAGDVNFGLTAENLNVAADDQEVNLIADAKVKVELSEGLRFKDSWSPPAAFVKSGSQSATWSAPDTDTEGDLPVGPLHNNSEDIEIAVQLTPGVSLDDIPREERCITAWVADSKPPPSPGYALGRLKQCLGDDPTVVFDRGELDLVTLHPCVGVTPIAYPCRDEDGTTGLDNGLEMVTSASFGKQLQTIRSSGIGRLDSSSGRGNYDVRLRPESVVVQVKDPEGREVDASNNLAWWLPHNQGVSPTLKNSLLTTDWTHFLWKIASVQLPTGGHVYYGPNVNRAAVYVNTNDKAQHPPGGFVAIPSVLRAAVPTYYRFTALGTYVIDFTQETRHNNGTGSDTSDDVDYLAKGRYTFHVGPIAELEVRDGGASSHAPADRNALTVLAVNNGPDAAPAAKVTLSDLDAGSCTGNATKGSVAFANEECVWTIGELITKDVLQPTSGRDGEILTIITSADADITAAISNTRDYQVCIDSSGNDVTLSSPSKTACTTEDDTQTWHTTDYYDYISGNNTASIAVREGTGAALPSAMRVAGVSATYVAWDRVDPLYGRAVTHYEIQRSTDGGNSWRMLSDRWPRTFYVDPDMSPNSNLHYRVRAVNNWLHKGPWARFAAGELAGGDESPQEPMNLRAKLNSGGSITLTWTWEAPGSLLYGDPLSHYEVQRQRGAWETIAYQVTDTEYTDFGAGGRMSPYRVRAVNVKGREGPWSESIDVVTAQQQGQLAAPALWAHTTTEDTIRLTWTVPSNQQGAVTGYELQYLDRDEWVTLEELPETETEYEDWDLPFGAVRTYRVRALDGESVGRWSNQATAMTPPGQPDYLWAEANGPNVIHLVWEPPGHDTHDTVQRYELEVSSTDQNSGYSRLASPSAAARSYTHSGLSPGSTRYYQLRACNSAGCGSWSFPAEATTSASGVPSAPGLTASTSGQWEEWGEWAITLSWNKPHDGGSPITSYQLDHQTDEYDWSFLDSQIPPDFTEFVHQEYFNPGETHRYRVRAVNDQGESAWSAIRSVTIPARPPFFPELSFGESTDSTITLNWTVPEANGSIITGYRVERNDAGGGDTTWKTLANVGQSVTTYTDRGLYQGEYYCYRVAANSNVGLGEYSFGECERTTGQPAVQPDSPLLRLSSVSPTGVAIAWDPPLDDGGRPVTNYVYEMSPFDYNCEYALPDKDLWPPGKCHLLSASGRSASFSGLTPGESYRFRVRAETSAWPSHWAEVTAYMPTSGDSPDTPEVTEDLQVRVSTTSISFSEGGEISYTVRLNKAPKEHESVVLDFYMDGSTEIFLDYSGDYDFVFDWDNWNSGFTFTLSAGEDSDSENEVAVMEHIILVGHAVVSGPSTRIEVRDND